MNRRHLHALLAPLVTLAVATSFVACDKKTADQPAKPPTTPGETPATPGWVAETVKGAVTSAPADIASIRGAYGVASQLPKDVEAFSVNLGLHGLWAKLSNSSWAAALVNLPALKEEPKFQQFLQQWNSPQAAKGKEILEALLGNEMAVAYPAGFTAKAMPWIELMSEVQGIQMQRGIMTAMSGGRPPDSAKLLREAAPEIIPALVKCDMPPVLLAMKAVKAKADIDGGIAMALEQLGMRLPPGVEIGKFKLADKHDFQNITLNGAKLVEAMQEEMIRGRLADLLGDEGKAKQAVEALKSKRIEIAFGWVGDYLFVSFGSDHAHLKFAAGDADSALALPAVARRAAQFLDKKPLGLAYASAGMFEKLHGKLEFAESFKKLSDELAGLLKPEHITAMQADVKRIEGKAQALYAAKFDPMVSVSYWDGGIRGEGFGGTQQTAFDTSKPLGFGSLLSKSVFLFADGRSNPANAGKYADLLEEGASTLWSWYEKYGRTMVPENERQGAAMVEAMAIPMVKDFWAACRTMSKALGDESALVLDFNGNVPKIPNLPPGLVDGKVPRMAWVSDLKDRAGVSEAWKGFDKIIKQLAAFAPGGAPIPEPQMKKEGDVEIHFIEPPIPTDDFLPHVAITKDRWIISTSPSFTKEITSKPAVAGGAPLGSEWRVQIPAACDLAEAWLKVVDKDPATFLRSSSDAKEYAKLRPTLGELIRLGRSIQSLEWRVFSEGSETRNSTYLKLEDLK
jgi:hypothetical protein